MKKCSRCRIEKSEECFHENSSKYGGLSCYCKACWASYTKTWRESNPGATKAIWDRARAKKRAAREAAKALIPAPTDKQCFKCKERKPFTEFNKNTYKKDGLNTYCRTCSAEKLRLFFNANKEKTRGYQDKYRAENAEKVNAYNARAKIHRRKMAVPGWADLEAIAEFYKESDRVTKETGIRHHVDHEIPLKGKLVSGLHVQNNLRVIPMPDNVKKSNKFEIEP